MTDKLGNLKVKNYSERCKVLNMRGQEVEIIPIASTETPFLQALQNLGFTAAPEEGVSHKNVPCQIVSQHLDQCPACRGRHGGTQWEFTTIVQSCWSFRNAHKSCEDRLLNPPTSLAEWNGNISIRGIFESPFADLDYVKLFQTEHESQYISDRSQIYHFDGVRWLPVADGQVITTMQTWLTNLFRTLAKLLAAEQFGSGDSRLYRDISNRLIKISSHLKAESAATTQLKAFKRIIGDDHLHDKMDKGVDKLGTNNGLIDLSTGLFRRAQPEDMVSMSVGYDYPTTWDPSVEEAMLTCLEQIYPIEAERELFGRFAGYCLLGHAPEKYLLVLTDHRNGFNAKSTILSLLSATMGEYAIKGDPVLLYKQDRAKGLNDHSAGLMAYKKKRFCYCEELDGSKHLDQGFIKDITGQKSVQTGRGMYQANVEEFEWITKLAIAFNQGCMPSWNVDDIPMVERLMCIPHRSRFVTGQLPQEPYTYPADPNFRESFAWWRPYFLKWCLQGLYRYRQKGFTDLPPGCLAFKQELVAEKDVVMEFVEEHVEPGEKTDFVQVKELYKLYDSVNRTLQRDRKTKKDSKAFEQSLIRCLGQQNFKPVHNFTTSGRKQKARSVFMSFRHSSQVAMDM